MEYKISRDSTGEFRWWRHDEELPEGYEFIRMVTGVENTFAAGSSGKPDPLPGSDLARATLAKVRM